MKCLYDFSGFNVFDDDETIYYIIKYRFNIFTTISDENIYYVHGYINDGFFSKFLYFIKKRCYCKISKLCHCIVFEINVTS